MCTVEWSCCATKKIHNTEHTHTEKCLFKRIKIYYVYGCLRRVLKIMFVRGLHHNHDTRTTNNDKIRLLMNLMWQRERVFIGEQLARTRLVGVVKTHFHRPTTWHFHIYNHENSRFQSNQTKNKMTTIASSISID